MYLDVQKSLESKIHVLVLSEFQSEQVHMITSKNTLYLSRTAIIDTPTNSTIELIKISMKLLKNIYKQNINYSKSKVFIGDIIPSNRVQTNLFDIKKDRRKLDKSIDAINSLMGRDTIQILSSGIKT